MDAASLVSAWNGLVLQLALAFATEQTARTWEQIALGWVLHRGAATVTGIYRVLGSLADRPYELAVPPDRLAKVCLAAELRQGPLPSTGYPR